MIGRGTGEWQVPVGGMGQVAAALETAARERRGELRRPAPRWWRSSRSRRRRHGRPSPTAGAGPRRGCWPTAPRTRWPGCAATGRRADPVGCQTKINLVLRRLPPAAVRARSGDRLRRDPAPGPGLPPARRGVPRRRSPAGCPTRCRARSTATPSPTRRSCRPELIAGGLPHADGVRAAHAGRAVPRRSRRGPGAGRGGGPALAAGGAGRAAGGLLAVDRDGRPCVEVLTPLDLERELRLPGGHIFHGDLAWPWLADGEEPTTPAERWGVATDHPRSAAVRIGRPARRRRQRSGRPQRRHGRCWKGRLLVFLLARR